MSVGKDQEYGHHVHLEISLAQPGETEENNRILTYCNGAYLTKNLCLVWSFIYLHLSEEANKNSYL
jgi:hypothetical protein